MYVFLKIHVRLFSEHPRAPSSFLRNPLLTGTVIKKMHIRRKG